MAGPDKGSQRFPVDIEELTESTGGTGFPVEDWATLLSNVWMSRRALGGSERFATTAGQPSSRGQIEWAMSYHEAMDPDLVDVPKLRRLSYRGTKYDILSADHVGRKEGVKVTTLSH